MTITLYDELATTTPGPRRRNGRYVVVDTAGKETTYQRMTNAIRVVDDDFGVQQWSKRNVALGVARNRDLIARVVAAADDKKALNALCEEAQKLAGGHEKRELGTALHDIVERINRGQTPEVADTFAADIDAYRAALAAHGIRPVVDLVEFVVVLDEHKVAGQADFMATVDGIDGLVVCDLKTGSVGFGGHWMKMAAQLGGYSRGTRYDPATDTRLPWPAPVNQDVGLIIHLPPGEGRCDVWSLDLNAGWGGFEAAMSMAATRSTKGIATQLVAGDAEQPPTNDAVSAAVVDGAVETASPAPSPGGKVRLIGSATPLPKAQAEAWARPDEGATLDLKELTEQITKAVAEWAIKAHKTDAEIRARLGVWRDQGINAGRPFHIHSSTGQPTERRRGIYGAAVRLAAFSVDDDDARDLIAKATGLEVQPGHTVGSVLGSLTSAEAAAIRGDLDAIAVGRADRQTA